MRYNNLFKPVTIGKLNLKNRIAFSSVGIGSYNNDGTITDENISFVRARTKEVSLIITTAAASSYRYGKLKFIGAYDDIFIPGLSKFARAGHCNGAKVFLQLFVMGGPNILADDLFLDVVPWVPSTDLSIYKNWTGRNKPKELKKNNIKELIDDYVQSAGRAKEAGFDGVEIKANEDYLLAAFLNPYFNKRIDEYGGNLNNMLRLPVEIIRGIKKLCGSDYPIGFKYNVYYDSPEGDGVNLDMGIKIGELIANEGIAYLHITPYGRNNVPYSLMEPTIMPNQYQPGNNVIPFAEHLKASVRNTLIMAASGILKPDEADEFIGEGKADLVAIARALIADEYWAQNAKDNKRFRPCTKCYVCLHEATKGDILKCSVNPDVLAKRKSGPGTVNTAKKVIVVGGGPGGIISALTASRRGHTVTLYEKNEYIGGGLVPGSMPEIKYEFLDLLHYYREELRESKVKVITGFKVTQRFIKKINPDVLIIAIGSEPLNVNIPGRNHDNQIDVFTAIHNADSYKNKKIIIIGGGSIGCETALLFRRKGNIVTIIEESGKLMKNDIMIYNTLILEKLLRKEWVEIRTNSKVINIKRNCVTIKDTESIISKLEADLVIAAIGLRSLSKEAKTLARACKNSYIIGDCIKPGRIKDSVHQGYKIGNLI